MPVCRAADPQAGRFPDQLLAFSATKEKQVRTMAANLNIKLPREVIAFFKAATNGDAATVSDTIKRLAPEFVASYTNSAGSQPAWIRFWQPMNEVESAYDAFATGGRKYPAAFGEGIIRCIPPGSIYFGGTDPGRMLVTALCESQADAKPFYTLTQNALSDGRYMEYLRAMYGTRIYLPTTNDVQQAIQTYKADALHRLRQGTLKPGEDVRLVNGQVQVNGPVCVMGIHALLVKSMLDHNPKQEFYLEESYPMERIDPYLSPHGFIFKLNHEPLPALTPQVLDADHTFWTKQCRTLIGDWLNPDTSLSNVCVFAGAVYGRKDWSHFTGERAYVTNAFAPAAFSKLRVSIAGLYHWRLMNATYADDRARLQAEADYAFRQAFALCPTSPEAVFRYVNFLMMQNRVNDAIELASTAVMLKSEDEQFGKLLSQLRGIQTQIQPKPR